MIPAGLKNEFFTMNDLANSDLFVFDLSFIFQPYSMLIVCGYVNLTSGPSLPLTVKYLQTSYVHTDCIVYINRHTRDDLLHDD